MTSFMPASASASTGVGCAADESADCRPEGGLQLGRPLVDPLALIVVLVEVELDSQAGVFGKKLADVCGIGGRQKVGAQHFGSDGVGLRLFEILALLIATCRHGKTEADDQTEQGQSGRKDDTEMLAMVVVRVRKAPPQPRPRCCDDR